MISTNHHRTENPLISLTEIHDPVFERRKYSRIDRVFLRFLRDKRDLPFLYLTIKLTLILIPWAVLLYLPFNSIIWWPLAIGYLIVSNIIFKGPFGLMLHCTSHRKLIKRKYEWMNHYLPWVIGPLFGQSPETYFSHHIGMHHPENNLPEDESSTMKYKRDSFRSFLIYFLDFIFIGIYRVTGYFKRKNRKRLFIKMIRGELLYLAVTIVLCFVSLKATMVVFILPLLISRFIMMMGNWTQHAFIAPNDPGNPYKNAITTINVKYNHKCWNDGYHISHHLRPAMHWTQHPKDFYENKEEYARNKALIFDGLDFGRIFILLMLKKYDKLASHVVNINQTFKSRQEVINIMKKRTQPIVANEGS